MSPVFSAAAAAVSSPPLDFSFRVHRSLASPTYYQLAIDDGRGLLACWVIPTPLKHLTKRPALLWRLPAGSPSGALTCLDAGSLRLAAAHPGLPPDLRADLAAGVLRLYFGGGLLRGYFHLRCLPESGGLFWQFTSLGYV